jgi:NADPH-dependent ferric siderophore reductase
MAASLEETLVSVWRQALVEQARSVTLRNRTFPVRRTSRSRLREVDFQFEGHELRGLEQNPETASRWAKLAREGKKVMQFLQQRRYIAVVVDGKVQFYGNAQLSDPGY